MDIKFVPAPANLIAVFDQESAHRHGKVGCPVVALIKTEFGQLTAMCGVAGHPHFVAIDELPPYLHKAYGGIFKFVEFAISERSGLLPADFAAIAAA